MGNKVGTPFVVMISKEIVTRNRKTRKNSKVTMDYPALCMPWPLMWAFPISPWGGGPGAIGDNGAIAPEFFKSLHMARVSACGPEGHAVVQRDMPRSCEILKHRAVLHQRLLQRDKGRTCRVSLFFFRAPLLRRYAATNARGNAKKTTPYPARHTPTHVTRDCPKSHCARKCPP
jgi:hypothetical protein